MHCLGPVLWWTGVARPQAFAGISLGKAYRWPPLSEGVARHSGPGWCGELPGRRLGGMSQSDTNLPSCVALAWVLEASQGHQVKQKVLLGLLVRAELVARPLLPLAPSLAWLSLCALSFVSHNFGINDH
jgi:hypothetical protein